VISATVVGLHEFRPPPTSFYFPPILIYTIPHLSMPYSNDSAEMNGRHSTVRSNHSTQYYWRMRGNMDQKVKWQELHSAIKWIFHVNSALLLCIYIYIYIYIYIPVYGPWEEQFLAFCMLLFFFVIRLMPNFQTILPQKRSFQI
jgi:hypothetical protein